MSDSHNYNIAPGPRGYALLGSLLDIRRNRLQFLMEVTRQFGDVVRFQMGHKIFHLISHPDYIKHVLQDNYKSYHRGIGLAQAKPLLGEGLLTSEEESWLRQRRLLQPVFHRQRITAFAPIMTDITCTMVQRWQSYVERGQPLDIAAEMRSLTLSILGKTLFGTDISSKADLVGSALTIVLEQAIRRMVALFELPQRLPTPQNLRFQKALRTLDQIVYCMIDERGREKSGSADLLSMLLLACDEETGTCLSSKQLRDEIMTIILAGHETTAVALSWVWYLLSKNPSVERQLHVELANVLNGRIPAFQDVPDLKYTKMVIEEAIRLYPPVWLIPRKAIVDDEIGSYHIPKGSGVLISPYAMHRHPAYWEAAEVFKPERFTSERIADHQHYVSFPFGGGPHYCIGSGFGMMEAQLIVAMVAQKYRLRTVAGHPVEPEPLLTLRPRYGILMTLETA